MANEIMVLMGKEPQEIAKVKEYESFSTVKKTGPLSSFLGEHWRITDEEAKESYTGWC